MKRRGFLGLLASAPVVWFAAKFLPPETLGDYCDYINVSDMALMTELPYPEISPVVMRLAEELGRRSGEAFEKMMERVYG